MNTINRTARLTGLLYFIQLPLSVFAILYTPSLFVPEDTLATVSNILTAETVFRLSIGAALVVQVSHLVIALLLFRILSPVNRTAGVYMVVFMAVSVPITMLNELTNIAILVLANAPSFLSAFSSEQLGNLVLFLHTLHEQGILIAQIFWGLWLFPMGYLIIRSDFVPKLLGYITLVVGASYLLDCFTWILLPGFSFSFAGVLGFFEILFPLWLLIRGVDAEKWEAQRAAPVV